MGMMNAIMVEIALAGVIPAAPGRKLRLTSIPPEKPPAAGRALRSPANGQSGANRCMAALQNW